MFEHNPLNPLTRLVVSRVAFDSGVRLLRSGKRRLVFERAGLEQVRAVYTTFLPLRGPGRSNGSIRPARAGSRSAPSTRCSAERSARDRGPRCLYGPSRETRSGWSYGFLLAATVGLSSLVLLATLDRRWFPWDEGDARADGRACAAGSIAAP